ncbi:hypothetical protein ACH5RR_015121 [Cinchona calisaya]|uniref:Pistil-specific extensin-like protein n=1 Tax=Cinchona calisaya TaxID=153742 RepID=A0ABD2ZVT5_9GENT
MASFPSKAIVLMQLSTLLLLSSMLSADETDFPHNWPRPTIPPVEPPKPHDDHHHHHPHPPSFPPLNPPAHPPVKPPVHPPYRPRFPPFTRKLVAVQGVVLCKDCKYAGIDTFMGAKPLVGAVVRLQCKNTKYRPVVAEGKTDENGYFLIMPQGLTTAGSHKCRVFLDKSPSTKCDDPTNINFGLAGAILKPTFKPSPLGPNYALFTVGPFAYAPSNKVPCPR